MNYVFICFGTDHSYYLQTKYAILTLLAFVPNQPAIHVFTDHHERFANFSATVNLIPLTEQQKAAWLNQVDSIFAIKLFGIQFISKQLSGDLMYLDTDIIVCKPLTPLIAQLNDTSALLYQQEYFLKNKVKPCKIMLQKMLGTLGIIDISHKTGYMASETLNKTWGNHYVNHEQAMWNSGVIGLSHANKPLLNDAIDIYKALQNANIRNNATEQLAIAISLNKVDKLIETTPYIYHYWHDKAKTTQLITQRLNQFEQQKLDLATILESIRKGIVKQ